MLFEVFAIHENRLAGASHVAPASLLCFALSVTRRPAPPNHVVGELDDGVSIAVEQMVANARGEIILNLNALESDAAADGEATDKLTVTDSEGSQKVEIDDAFEIRMTNTTAFE